MTLVEKHRAAGLSGADIDWASPGTLLSLGVSAPEHLHSVVRDVEALLALPDDWDSYGARRIKWTAAKLAVTLLVDSGWEGPLPTVSPTTTGGVMLEWGNDDDGVELYVDGDGPIAFLIDVDGEMSEGRASGVGDQKLYDALAWARKLA